MSNYGYDSIEKTLSKNDTGETGGHQAGIHVPKDPDILSFFPRLDRSEKNPRRILTMADCLEQRWKFAFIYYNNKFFGGTRNEFRLTRLTDFFRSHNLKAGDVLIIERDEGYNYIITYRRFTHSVQENAGKLKLCGDWKVIRI